MQIESKFKGVLSNLPKLEEVTIENASTRLVYNMFSYNENLKKVTLPEGYKTIPYNCFNGCVKLSDVNIPDSVEEIDEYAFCHCPIKTLNLKNVKSIGYFAFAENSALTSVKLPKSVTQISYAFVNDNKLADIVIDSGAQVSSINGKGYAGAFARTAWEKEQQRWSRVATLYPLHRKGQGKGSRRTHQEPRLFHRPQGLQPQETRLYH